MRTNKEILDEFGEKLIKTVFDFNYEIIKSNILFNYQKETLKENIEVISRESIESLIFDFLKFFEENEEFKIYYERDNQKIDLVEISEMLKAEPIIENGWIERFSESFK